MQLITPPDNISYRVECRDARRVVATDSVSERSKSQQKCGDEPKLHYYWLDLVRFIAAFLVLACHYRGAFLEEYSVLSESDRNPVTFVFYFLTRLGDEAVIVFFVLSGFLVGGKVIERTVQHTFNPVSYSIDRAVRIMLPLISALLFSVLLMLSTGQSVDWFIVIGNLFSLQGVWCPGQIEVLWSLSYEVWFYIMAGALAVVLDSKKRSMQWLCCIILFICILIFTKLKAHYLFVWMMGAVAYWVMPKRQKLWILIVSAFAVGICVVGMQLNFHGNFSVGLARLLPTQNRGALTVMLAFAFCIFLQQIILFKPTGRFSMWLNHTGTKLAAFSYTLYLVHVPILRLIQYLGGERLPSVTVHSISLYILWLACGLVGSYFVYLMFEKHTAAVKRWIKTMIIGTKKE